MSTKRPFNSSLVVSIGPASYRIEPPERSICAPASKMNASPATRLSWPPSVLRSATVRSTLASAPEMSAMRVPLRTSTRTVAPSSTPPFCSGTSRSSKLRRSSSTTAREAGNTSSSYPDRSMRLPLARWISPEALLSGLRGLVVATRSTRPDGASMRLPASSTSVRAKSST